MACPQQLPHPIAPSPRGTRSEGSSSMSHRALRRMSAPIAMLAHSIASVSPTIPRPRSPFRSGSSQSPASGGSTAKGTQGPTNQSPPTPQRKGSVMSSKMLKRADHIMQQADNMRTRAHSLAVRSNSPMRPRSPAHTGAFSASEGAYQSVVILFLDVDGVLNSQKSRDSGDDMPVQFLHNLARIVCITQAKIVLTSAWRLKRKAKRAVEIALSTVNCDVYSATPDLSGDSCDRVDEIFGWMQMNTDIRAEAWVAIDDQDLVASNKKLSSEHFVQTDDATGLTRSKTDEAINKITEQRKPHRDRKNGNYDRGIATLERTRITVLGGPSCAIFETAYAISQGSPYFQDDRRIQNVPATDFVLARMGGPNLMVQSFSGDQPFDFAQLDDSIDACIVLFNEDDEFLSQFGTGAAEFVRKIHDASSCVPVMLMPTVSREDCSKPFNRKTLERAEQFAEKQASLQKPVMFMECSASSPPSEITALLDILLDRRSTADGRWRRFSYSHLTTLSQYV